MLKTNGVSQVEGKDNRFIESCFRVLQSKHPQINASFKSPVEDARIINQFIASLEGTPKEKEQLVQSLITEAKKSLLPLDEFSWIKGDERACYFVWASIYLYYYYSAPSHPTIVTSGHTPTYALYYNQLSLKNNPSDNMERFDEVVKYFDRIPQPSRWKLDLIAHLKGIWGYIFSNRKPFSWLEKDNDEQCRWAWDYINKIDWDNSKPMISQLSVTSTEEMYFAIYAAYDTWKAKTEAKRLFTIDFNKAWQQKKHRDSRQGKKACSLVLQEDVKLKLDELAKTRKVTLSQLVEQLIEKEYRLKDS